MLSNVNSGSISIINKITLKLSNPPIKFIAVVFCDGTSNSISMNPLLKKLDGTFKLYKQKPRLTKEQKGEKEKEKELEKQLKEYEERHLAVRKR